MECQVTHAMTFGSTQTELVSFLRSIRSASTWNSLSARRKSKPSAKRRLLRRLRRLRKRRLEPMNIDFEAIAFVIMALIAILGALGCVYARRVAHSLLSLMMTFFAVAGVMVLAHAEMLAAIQILVYLGSVMLVVQFGVMLTRRQIQEGDVL
ncbi:MAG: hypothetical protein CMA06_05070 [Euryarchaeota archaeon]|nr:hypothetical protein [Euryarchaeota archaeon]RCH71842.1 MAG: hypothetical protein DBX06_04850 [Candidatus Poseidoniales archaeon]RCH72588.1 MAG: hypothetical protein DBX06_01565 [Candidatus Poseidoniales archaeon]